MVSNIGSALTPEVQPTPPILHAAAGSVAVCLKVEYEGEFRRARLEGCACYDDIEKAVQEIWPGHNVAGATYLDEAGDACTLSEKTFPDFMAIASRQNDADLKLLQLKLACQPNPPREQSDTKRTEAWVAPANNAPEQNEMAIGAEVIKQPKQPSTEALAGFWCGCHCCLILPCPSGVYMSALDEDRMSLSWNFLHFLEEFSSFERGSLFTDSPKDTEFILGSNGASKHFPSGVDFGLCCCCCFDFCKARPCCIWTCVTVDNLDNACPMCLCHPCVFCRSIQTVQIPRPGP